ncbi:TPA: RNA methyltransferase [Candidatus Gastranaerophilales bacterium HUM_20]|nr:fIG011178: rRNA methylase [Clostridium sp. CAG:729]DAB22280.1 MAG TPA: RNA methyltransferase [Candidatus Gastranaerophilales bacterium HUM_20]
MQEITSVNNDLVKETVKFQQKKYRDKENKFLLEGFKSIEEAFNVGIEIEYAFVLKEKAEQYKFLGEKVILTTEPVLKKISTTDSAPDAVAVGVKKHYDNSILNSAKKVVLLENIKDLGNLGTILRTSTAFGADAVVLFGSECADLYNPKCVRSSVGNLWKIPVLYIRDIHELEKYFSDFQRIATLPRAEKYLKDFRCTEKCLIMFGSEADGLSDELVNFSTDSVKIEMASSVESLNLSISCAVVLYKLFL